MLKRSIRGNFREQKENNAGQLPSPWTPVLALEELRSLVTAEPDREYARSDYADTTEPVEKYASLSPIWDLSTRPCSGLRRFAFAWVVFSTRVVTFINCLLGSSFPRPCSGRSEAEKHLDCSAARTP